MRGKMPAVGQRAVTHNDTLRSSQAGFWLSASTTQWAVQGDNPVKHGHKASINKPGMLKVLELLIRLRNSEHVTEIAFGQTYIVASFRSLVAQGVIV
ncbi:hypothetical protein LENED_001576 [Lentinula edodes]|uniref:Uncharacterized protein n=1 Tax=Lentinula edodes TaxID=5353 RepID=A0A1Q3DYJ9_LENED|nr:hypothetical protein LENED_001576 [Lentinula edodes]